MFNITGRPWEWKCVGLIGMCRLTSLFTKNSGRFAPERFVALHPQLIFFAFRSLSRSIFRLRGTVFFHCNVFF